MRIGCAIQAAQLLFLACIGVVETRPQKYHGGKLFKEADSPYAGDAPIPIFGDKCADVHIIDNAELTSYGDMTTALYTPPDCSDWSQALLRLDGSVKGLQFDRFGAVWLSGVELLRTTTPEPTEKGIRWQVLRDITSSSSLLRTPGNLTLHIPNIVNQQYTGVIFASVSIEFFRPDHITSNHLKQTLVRPIYDWKDKSPNIFLTNVTGEQTQTNIISDLPQNMVSARLELFASGHNCEEFWYANLPGKDSYTLSEDMNCGGGAYRELEVHVDGKLAGITYPFPVIYTGGLNPLLWRPQTGIASFDVPPYNFDLSPFVGTLNDGKSHNISLTVNHGDDNHGTWYLNGVLHAELDPHVAKYEGELLHHKDEIRDLTVDKDDDKNTATYSTKGGRQLTIMGSLRRANSRQGHMFSTMHSLTASNLNTVGGKALQIAHGWMQSTTTQRKYLLGEKAPLESVIHQSRYPYFFFDHTATDPAEMTIENGPSKVNYSRLMSLRVQRFGEKMYELEVSGNIQASALYNQSLGSDMVASIETGKSEQRTSVNAGNEGHKCFHTHLSASVDGKAVQEHHATETCDWLSAPWGLYACGLSFCKQLDGIGRKAKSFRKAIHASTAQSL
jgi:hypothetical protein